MEPSPHATTVLNNNDIATLGEIVEYLEEENKLAELKGMNDAVLNHIYDKLEAYGYDGGRD